MLPIKKKFNLIYIVILSAFISACSVKGEPENKKTSIQTLPVTQLITKDTILHHDYVADIQARRHVEVRARVNGFLDNIYVDEGQ
ncbi:MAG: efflux transporter periplasmic adaptor subunit, partial [Bacteroidota bacterium]|nr:efflux transporter periplasmic adaptor subunit [Bacteroidota bacterium]